MEAERDSTNVPYATASNRDSVLKHVTTDEGEYVSSDDFDGTANLTLEGGTILIPAPTADPQGMPSRSGEALGIMVGRLNPMLTSSRSIELDYHPQIYYFMHFDRL